MPRVDPDLTAYTRTVEHRRGTPSNAESAGLQAKRLDVHSPRPLLPQNAWSFHSVKPLIALVDPIDGNRSRARSGIPQRTGARFPVGTYTCGR